MYESTCAWRDLTDGHVYAPGERFPFDGREISPERIETLINGGNLAGKPVIAEVRDLPSKAPEPRRAAKKPAKNAKK